MRRIKENYVSGEHMAIDDLKKKHRNQYTAKKVAEPNKMTYINGYPVVPYYPRPVAFHCSRVSHVTTTDGMKCILDRKGFRRGDRRPGLLWWGTLIGENETLAAEQRYLEKLFPDRSPEERERQEPFLRKFSTSPVFKDGSRYGNFRFTFSLADVMKEYSTQFCGGAHPVLRVYETVIYKQEVMYVVLIHSPDVHDFDGYPELGDNDEGVCAYRDGEIIWRAQAISQTHRYRLTENRDDKQVSVGSGFKVFYVWDHVTLAFHMPEGQNLVFPLETLLKSLTACGGAVNNLNPVIGKVKAGKIVQEKKADA